MPHLLAFAGIALGWPLAAWGQSFDVEGIGRTVSQAGAAIGAEMTKATIVNKNVSEGIEAFRRSVKLQGEAVELQGVFKQPDGLCQTMEAQSALTAEALAGRARAAGDQRKVLGRASVGTNAVASLESSFARSASYCTVEEGKLGVCEVSKDARFTNLAGADQDALYLFQGRVGGNTYEGGRDGPQAQAVEGYIRRVVVGVPTEPLRTNRKGYQENPQARSYVELQRRYQAFLSMSAYSLNQIKESRTPSK